MWIRWRTSWSRSWSRLWRNKPGFWRSYSTCFLIYLNKFYYIIVTLWYTYSLTHSLTHRLSRTSWATHSLTHSLTHSRGYSLTHEVTHSLTHSLMHPVINTLLPATYSCILLVIQRMKLSYPHARVLKGLRHQHPRAIASCQLESTRWLVQGLKCTIRK